MTTESNKALVMRFINRVQNHHNTTPLELKLPIGPHTIEVRREGFSSIPRDVIVEIEKGETKHVSFTFNRD